jgi:hypothetical protein
MLGFTSKWFDERTTGRFGLGFKSVYLVTDDPLIVSRWLAVRIKGTLFAPGICSPSALRQKVDRFED